jgi:hypothetical protein
MEGVLYPILLGIRGSKKPLIFPPCPPDMFLLPGHTPRAQLRRWPRSAYPQLPAAIDHAYCKGTAQSRLCERPSRNEQRALDCVDSARERKLLRTATAHRVRKVLLYVIWLRQGLFVLPTNRKAWSNCGDLEFPFGAEPRYERFASPEAMIDWPHQRSMVASLSAYDPATHWLHAPAYRPAPRRKSGCAKGAIQDRL